MKFWCALLLVVPLLAPPTARARKVAVLPLAAGDGVSAPQAAGLTDAVAASLERLDDTEVVTQQQILAILQQEGDKTSLGCDSAGCHAQIANALGADELVTGALSILGRSHLLALRRINAATGSARSSNRRLQHAAIDDVLDVIPAMVAELYDVASASLAITSGGASTAPPPAVAAAASAPAAPMTPTAPAAEAAPHWIVSSSALPAASAERPLSLAPEVLARMQVLRSAEGQLILRDPDKDSFAPFFAGTVDKLFAQRVIGGGREGDVAWNEVFWDPRLGSNWRSSMEFRDGRGLLRCGDRVIEFTLVGGEAARRVQTSARFFDVRWQRQLHAVVRDDEGRWWVIDRDRHARQGPPGAEQFRVYSGQRGSFSLLPLMDAILDSSGELYLFRDAHGTRAKLTLQRDGSATWDEGGRARPLRWLDLHELAPQAYSSLGLYREALGTACDAFVE